MLLFRFGDAKVRTFFESANFSTNFSLFFYLFFVHIRFLRVFPLSKWFLWPSTAISAPNSSYPSTSQRQSTPLIPRHILQHYSPSPYLCIGHNIIIILINRPTTSATTPFHYICSQLPLKRHTTTLDLYISTMRRDAAEGLFLRFWIFVVSLLAKDLTE